MHVSCTDRCLGPGEGVGVNGTFKLGQAGQVAVISAMSKSASNGPRLRCTSEMAPLPSSSAACTASNPVATCTWLRRCSAYRHRSDPSPMLWTKPMPRSESSCVPSFSAVPESSPDTEVDVLVVRCLGDLGRHFHFCLECGSAIASRVITIAVTSNDVHSRYRYTWVCRHPCRCSPRHHVAGFVLSIGTGAT